jgi:hypothetical protein
MQSNITKFCNALDNLDPEKSDGLIADLYDLVDLLEGENEITSIYESVFRFLEKYPEADIGNPGPLVHLLECHYPSYVPVLIVSVEQSPTYNTVIMLHRIMNSKLSREDRSRYLALLKAAADNDTADEITKENAQELYEFQIEKNS